MGAPVVRFEIGCKDKPKVTAFYEEAFGWTMTPSGTPSGPATEVDTGFEKGVHGAITALGHEPHQYVMVYIEVADADKACETIAALGGSIRIGPIDIPDGKGRFAWFSDPEGNMLGLIQPPR